MFFLKFLCVGFLFFIKRCDVVSRWLGCCFGDSIIDVYMGDVEGVMIIDGVCFLVEIFGLENLMMLFIMFGWFLIDKVFNDFKCWELWEDNLFFWMWNRDFFCWVWGFCDRVLNLYVVFDWKWGSDIVVIERGLELVFLI